MPEPSTNGEKKDIFALITTNRQHLFSSEARLHWLKTAVILGFIASIILSLRLWVSSRLYPLTPIVDFFPPIPYPLDWIILSTIILSLIAAIFVSKSQKYIWTAVALVLLLVTLDQSRLQPWVYQYVFMLTVFTLFSRRIDDLHTRDATLNTCRLIIAAIYFWSGLQKVNILFINDVFPWIVSPVAQLFPDSAQPLFHTLGMIVPFIEISIGIGLLTKKFRNVAIVFALCMCAFVLWTIGPWGHYWNTVVWPWNITMAALVIILFFRAKDVSPLQILWVRNHFFHKIILIVFGLLPLLYFFNYWDAYPSWSLYSGTTNESFIYMDEKVKNQLPTYIQSFVQEGARGEYILNISTWSFNELNVPPYPETRIFKNIAQRICGLTGNPEELLLAMRGRLTWFNNEGPDVLACTDL